MTSSILPGIILTIIVFCIPITAQFQNIKVNSNSLTSCNEPSIAINPTDTDNLVIGTNLRYYFYSFDGGQTWDEGQMFSSYGVWGDPSLIFDLNGDCYFAHLSGEPPLSGRWADRIVIQKSTDGGMSWDDGTYTGLNRPKFEDKEWITADRTNSIYQNNLYVAWTEFDSLFTPLPEFKSRELFSRSTDGGETWSNPIKLNEIDGDCMDDDNTIEGATPTVGPDGEVYLAWAGPEGILFDRSFDGGVTFGEDKFVSEHVGGWGWGNEVPGIYGNGLPQTYCDISNSSYRGTIYIIWADQRNGIINTDIFLIKSTDKGETWSDIKQVNNDESQRPQFYPWMTIDPITGIMYVVYYDRRYTIGTMTEVFIARSTDGGETFYNFKISESAFETTVQEFLGDYINIVAYNGKAYPVWTQTDQFGRSIMMTTIDENTLSAESDNLLPGYNLQQNFPNPFNPVTNINFAIGSRQFVSLKIFDTLGNEVATLVEEEKAAGEYKVEFHPTSGIRKLASGIYFYQLVAGDYRVTKKMIFLQ